LTTTIHSGTLSTTRTVTKQSVSPLHLVSTSIHSIGLPFQEGSVTISMMWLDTCVTIRSLTTSLQVSVDCRITSGERLTTTTTQSPLLPGRNSATSASG